MKTSSIRIKAPRIGTYWKEQGGVFAGMMRGIKTPDYFLVVPRVKRAEFESLPYGAYGENEPDAVSEFDGFANTQALVASTHDHPAAQACAALKISGFNDFYLPARFELALCYANARDLFQRSWYWSSTQYSASYAWCQGFSGGSQDWLSKNRNYRVRAVRRVFIHSVI